MKNTLKFLFMLLLFISASTFFNTVYAQRSSKINPIMSQTGSNVGWRNVITNKSENFDVNNKNNPKKVSNLRQSSLISVLPNSYCAISDFKRRSRRGMMRFEIDLRLQNGGPIEFSAEKNIYLEYKGKRSIDSKSKIYRPLPSGTLKLESGKNISGEINLPIHDLFLDSSATLCVQIGNDIHKFELSGSRDYRGVQELALVPYHPVWYESPIEEPEEPKKEEVKKNEEDEKVVKAVAQVEDITGEIKGDLRELLETLLAELRANRKLTENTKVDVNAEVMPEVKSGGSIEYNMKIRYDVQVLNEHLKKLNIANATEDWESGKYRLKDSQAALQTAGIIKSTIESKIEEYILPGTEVTVKIIGGTDASPFKNTVPYDGSFGDIVDAECFVNGGFDYITVTKSTGISSNAQLAYLRTLDIRDFMERYIGAFRVANVHYEHFAEIADEVGAEYRRVAVEVTVHNAFQQKYPELASFKENVYERTSEVDSNIPETERKLNAVAVIIGNTDYKVATGKQGTTKVGPVKYAVNDAYTMRDYLVKSIGVPADNIIFKVNADKKDFDAIFGRDSIGGELHSLVERTGAREVYFFYSGHGYPFMGEPYLLGVRSNPKSCKEQATSLQSIYRVLGNLPVDRVNVITDACFSGQSISMEASATEFVRRPKPDRLAKFVILSAAGEDQYANWYNDKKHGVFSYALFKAIQNKEKSDLNGDGVLSFDELYRYISDDKGHGVPYLVGELEGEQVKQTPVMQASVRERESFVEYKKDEK